VGARRAESSHEASEGDFSMEVGSIPGGHLVVVGRSNGDAPAELILGEKKGIIADFGPASEMVLEIIKKENNQKGRDSFSTIRLLGRPRGFSVCCRFWWLARRSVHSGSPSGHTRRSASAIRWGAMKPGCERFQNLLTSQFRFFEHIEHFSRFDW